MIGTLSVIVVGLLLIWLSQRWWRGHLNPITLGVIAWMPALIMLNWPPYFLSPLYIHLNRPVSLLVFYAMALAFVSFWAGCALVKAMSKPDAFAIVPQRLALRVDPVRMTAIFLVGLGIFLYGFWESGLTRLGELDAMQIAESRAATYLGPISLLARLMDIAAIGFFARFMQTGRWINLVPILIALICYFAILQKSLLMWIVSAAILVAALHPRASHYLLWRSPPRKAMAIALALGLIASLFAINTARGISDVALTASSSRTTEQTYIYSGASAIMNMSVTLEGYLPTDPPRYGAYLARPVLWHFVDRDLFQSGRFFEGINSTTYLVSGWLDFRWAGFFITPFLTGILVMLFLRAALSGSLAGLIFGAVAARSVIFSSATDVMFEPLTWITLVLAVFADFAVRTQRPRRPASVAVPDPGVPAAGPVR